MNSSCWKMFLLATTIWLLAIGGQLTAGWSFLKSSKRGQVENSNNSVPNVGMSQVAQDGANGEKSSENVEGPRAGGPENSAPALAPKISLMEKPAIKFSIYGVVTLIILGLVGTGLSYYQGWFPFAGNAIITTLDPLLNQNITNTNSTTTTVPPSIDMSNILLLSVVSLSLVGVGIFLYRRNQNKNQNKNNNKNNHKKNKKLKDPKTRASKTSDPGSNATGEEDLKNSDNPDNDNMDGEGEEGGDPKTNLKADLKKSAQSKVSINSKMSNIGGGASKVGGAGLNQSNYEKDDQQPPKPPGTSSGFVVISKHDSQFQQQLEQAEPISKYNRQTQRNTKKPPPDGAGGGQPNKQYSKMMPTVSMLMMMDQGSPENIPEVPAKKGGRGGGDPKKGGKKTGKNANMKKPMKQSPGRKPCKRAR